MDHPRLSPQAKRAYGRGFGADAAAYDAVRPGYPAEVLTRLEGLAAGRPVLDVGAGTGKLSAGLAARGCEVTAVDPDRAALTRNPVPGLLGTAEALPVASGAFGLATAAQAWHWFDAPSAAAELRRVLAPGGAAAIVVNQLDVRLDWVLRLSRIMHAGDVYRPSWRPELPGFGPSSVEVVEFRQEMSVERAVELAATRSYWLRSDEATRARVAGNIRDFLGREHPMPEPFGLPYLCLLAVARARS